MGVCAKTSVIWLVSEKVADLRDKNTLIKKQRENKYFYSVLSNVLHTTFITVAFISVFFFFLRFDLRPGFLMSLERGSKDENHHLPKENNSISNCMMVSGREGRLLGSLATS